MRAVIFSDIHLHAFQPFSRIDPETGLNTRLVDGINALAQIREYCKKNDIEYVLNGGDLLHKGATVQADLLELLIRELTEFKLEKIEIISIIGQHDFLRRDGSYSLPKALNPLMTVLNDPGDYVDIGDSIRIVGCSYREGLWEQQYALEQCKKAMAPDRKNILLGHFMVQEILKKNAAPFDVSDYISLSDFPDFDWIFLGDYHYHVDMPENRIVSIGSVMQHTFGDKNRPQGGFLDVDFSELDEGILGMRRVEIEAPRFITVSGPSVDKFPKGYSSRDFYSIEVEDEKQQDKIKARVDETWHLTFPIKGSDEIESADGVIDVGVRVDMHPEEVLKRFAQHFGLKRRELERGLSYI